MDFSGRVDHAIEAAIRGDRIVGAVTIVARDGAVVYRKARGWLDREAGIPMMPHAIFRLASVTKPIVSATALAMVERGLLGLDNAVADHLDWFRPRMADGREPKITIRQLLTHTSGLGGDYADLDPSIGSGLTDTNLGLEETYRIVAEHPLKFEPGTAWRYGASTDVLGAVVAAIHGGTLEDAVTHYITGPLRMKDTGFHVTDRDRLAVPYADGPPGLRRMGKLETVIGADGGRTRFSPDRIFNPRSFQSAGAGAAGTADDLIMFFEALRQRGGSILNPDVLAQAIQNQIGDLPQEADRDGQRFGFLGAIVVDPALAKRPQAAGTIRWGGIYGHDWFVDFANGLTAVMLTNTAVEGCTGAYPREVARAIYGV